ncbi:MAG: hypothetical protein ACI8W7_005076 [Gammaproteobacteria bacterium]|jgi:hypothetical protein
MSGLHDVELEDQLAANRPPTQRALPGLTVYYDGRCPLCRRETGFYQRRSHNTAIEWVDVSVGGGEQVAADLTRCDGTGTFPCSPSRWPRFASGAGDFGELWAATPGFHWLGAITHCTTAIGTRLSCLP